MSGRTKAQIAASVRDGPYCVFCKNRKDKLVPGTDVHHILGRKPGADIPEACVTLCFNCHRVLAHNGQSPTKAELIQLMKEVYGIDLWLLLPEYAN